MTKNSRGNPHFAKLGDRVRKSLLYYGCGDVVAAVIGDRTIAISGSATNASERSLAVAAVRTVPGVRVVVNDIKVVRSSNGHPSGDV